MPAVDTPDVEALMIRLLKPLGFAVSTKVPAKRDPEFIRVSVTGGDGGFLIDTPTLLVECWSASSVVASEMARKARVALIASRFDVVDGWQVYGIECAYPVYFPDETSDRYQFLCTVRVRRHN